MLRPNGELDPAGSCLPLSLRSRADGPSYPSSCSPPSPFLVTALRSPTPYPNSPVLNPSSTPTSRPPRTPTRRLRSNTPSHTLSLLPDPPATPSASTGPGTAGCGFDIFHDDEPINGAVSAFASSSSSLFPSEDSHLAILAASPAPSGSSAFEDYQPDKENKAPALLTSYPLMPSPLKRRRDVQPDLELDEDDDEAEVEAQIRPAAQARGSPTKGWKGKARALTHVNEEEVEQELPQTVLASVKGKGKGKGRAILELEADEGDLLMGEDDKGLELTPGRKVVGVVAADKKRTVSGGSPGKKRRGK